MEFEDPDFLWLWCLVDRLGVNDVAEAFVASICRQSKIESADSSEETSVTLPFATSEYHKASLIQHFCDNPRSRKNGSCYRHLETALLAISLMSVFTPFLKNIINSHFLNRIRTVEEADYLHEDYWLLILEDTNHFLPERKQSWRGSKCSLLNIGNIIIVRLYH
jgi:hypothetical protein